MSAGQSSSFGSLAGYGTILAGGTSFLIYTNYTREYTLSWFWNTSQRGYQLYRGLMRSIANYTCLNYYPRSAGLPKAYYSYAVVKARIKGYAQHIGRSAVTCSIGQQTSKDWWNLTAFGYWLAATGKLQTVVRYVKYYHIKMPGHSYRLAYEKAYGLKWSDYIPARTQTGFTYKGFVYYKYYWYWNKG